MQVVVIMITTGAASPLLVEQNQLLTETREPLLTTKTKTIPTTVQMQARELSKIWETI